MWQSMGDRAGACNVLVGTAERLKT